MLVEENFDYKRKRVPVHIVLAFHAKKIKKKLITQLEGVSRRLYHKNN